VAHDRVGVGSLHAPWDYGYIAGTSHKEAMLVFARRQDGRSPLEKALDAAADLKPGSWAGVEALSMLAIEAQGRSEAESLYASAVDASNELKPGSWESVRALTWLARAGRELSAD
jgi:hypothetical protein